jgi:hypothetical protein
VPQHGSRDVPFVGTTARHLGRVSWPPARFACSSDAVIVAVRRVVPAVLCRKKKRKAGRRWSRTTRESPSPSSSAPWAAVYDSAGVCRHPTSSSCALTASRNKTAPAAPRPHSSVTAPELLPLTAEAYRNYTNPLPIETFSFLIILIDFSRWTRIWNRGMSHYHPYGTTAI